MHVIVQRNHYARAIWFGSQSRQATRQGCKLQSPERLRRQPQPSPDNDIMGAAVGNNNGLGFATLNELLNERINASRKLKSRLGTSTGFVVQPIPVSRQWLTMLGEPFEGLPFCNTGTHFTQFLPETHVGPNSNSNILCGFLRAQQVRGEQLGTSFGVRQRRLQPVRQRLGMADTKARQTGVVPATDLALNDVR